MLVHTYINTYVVQDVCVASVQLQCIHTFYSVAVAICSCINFINTYKVKHFIYVRRLMFAPVIDHMRVCTTVHVFMHIKFNEVSTT